MHQGHTRRTAVRHDVSRLSEDDIHWLNEGSHFRLYEKLGAHPMQAPDGTGGVYFGVFAPHAHAVSVFGSFNDWDKDVSMLRRRDNSGVWEGFVPEVAHGATYKFHIWGQHDGYEADKADPYGFRHDGAPSNASIVWALDHTWDDGDWMATRQAQATQPTPVSIYEVHLGSWMRGEDNVFLNYREIAERLAEYTVDMGFTHVEIMPVTEHPFYASWGYQSTGYFAPTSRYGTPQDFMYFVDCMHQHDIGVILDWVPGHFPTDAHGLGYFDGTHLYEHPDPRRGIHPEWQSFVFDYERPEVQSLLFSNAFFWADKYHVDGFRVDAVSSMLYLNYSREDGDWIPNQYGGQENLEAVAFFRRFHAELATRYPDVRSFAEESTAWPMVSRPGYLDGLGFDYKWDMGWMNDTLAYFQQDPIYRKFYQQKLTFRLMYAFSENYVLPLSHDEVVHGKGSLLDRMPGDYGQKFANLKVLLGNQYMQPGKKMLFMGSELAQWREWNHDTSLDWNLLEYPAHAGVQQWVKDLNRLYRSETALHEQDSSPDGFEWIDCLDNDNSVISFLRKGRDGHTLFLAIFNHTPLPRHDYRVGVPRGGHWQEVLNSDATCYGGAGAGNLGGVHADSEPNHHHPCSLALTLPPLSCLVFRSAL